MENFNEMPVVTGEALSAIARAEIDIQIATARRFPRVLSKVKADMMSFATLDEETAQSCFYTLSRKSADGESKPIQGPSIRLAEIALSAYGNIKAGARVVSNDGKIITAQAVCQDLEKNVTVDMHVQRRITNKYGKTYSEDMQAVTGNAACALALRNAVFKVVPFALVKPVYMEARRVAIGDIKSLAAKRAKVIERLIQMGLTQDRILAAVEAAKVEDVDLNKLEILIGLGTSLKDGETTLEEAFPPIVKPSDKKPEEKTAAKPTTQDGAGTSEGKPKDEPNTTTPPAEPAPTETPQGELLKLLQSKGFGFAEFIEWAVATGQIDAPVQTIDEFPTDKATLCLRGGQRLMLKGLEANRG